MIKGSIEFLKSNTGLFIAILMVLIRLPFIEADTPEWKVGNYQPIDEQYYVSNALNLYEGKDVFKDSSPRLTGIPILQNVFSYLSLIIFGDNYIGLRFGTLFLSALSVYMVGFLLSWLKIQWRIRLLALIFLVFNYNFHLSSLIVEPTSSRITTMLFSVIISIWLFSGGFFYKWKFLVYGFILMLLVLITYPTNLFNVLSGFVFLLIICYKKVSISTVLKYLTLFSSGVILAFLFYGIIAYQIGENLFLLGAEKGSTYGSRVGYSPEILFNNLYNIRKANFLRFNTLFGIIAFTSLVGVVVHLLKTRNSGFQNVTLVLIFFVSFLCQTFFINDYPSRKLIILLPLVLIMVAFILNKLTYSANDLTLKNYILYFIFVIALVIMNLWSFYYTVDIVSVIATFGMLSVLLLLTLKKIRIKLFLILFFVMLLIPEFFMINKEVISGRSFNYREMQKSLSKYDQEVFLGGVSMGTRLYNNIDARFNMYLFYGQEELYFNKINTFNKRNAYSVILEKDMDFFKNAGFNVADTLLTPENVVSNNNNHLFLMTKVQQKAYAY